ncbi:Farnesoate epoxidase [Orchesella cincta]|uniref:Farnesoate epoxidase n=1 Tax=Orchesella cincta TaxID=48709 RepID=A0A1D2MU08_ORCCI|nr:Farnesoate epoxidase [Orchesella cincta]
MILEIILFCLILGLAKICILPKKHGSLPPGPPPLPIIGNIHQIFGKDVHHKFCKWSKEYGKLYTAKFGNRRVLVISDPKHVKNLFSHPASNGRFIMEMFHVLGRGPYGVVNTEGNLWSEQRNFCIRTLKSFGFNGSSRAALESQILQDLQHTLNDLSIKTVPVPIFNYIKRWQSKVMWKIITGERETTQTSEDCYDKVAFLTNNYLIAMGNAVETGLAFLPWLKYLAPERSGYNNLRKGADKLHDLVTDQLNKRMSEFSPGSAKSIMEAYGEKLRCCNDPKSTFHGEVGMLNSISTLLELLSASGDTIPHSVNWLMLYVSHHQNVQQKLCEEINHVIGNDRCPSLLDRINMPYCEAVIQEVLRFSSVAWMGVPHQLMADIDFEGYTLTKGLILLPNLYFIHHDPATWGDPENFRPERFIGKDGSFVRHDCMMPFGVGKRVCFGESLARDLMFLFIVKFFQTLNVFPESSETSPDFNPNFGLILTAKPFNVNTKRRIAFSTNCYLR